MSEWTSKKLREVIGHPIAGTRPAGGVNTETEGIPSLGGENILSDGGITFENLNRVPLAFYKSMPRGRLQPLDVLINKDGAQTGKVGLYKGDFLDACVNEHLFILRNNNGAIDQGFLFYSVLLPETQTKIARRITGSAQPGLNTTFVNAVDILVPVNSGEQRRIAKILSTLDETIEQTKALIAKYQEIKVGLMQDLFTRGVTPDGRLRPTRDQAPHLYKKSPLGWIPKEWKFGVLDGFSDIHNNLRKPISAEVRETMHGEYPYYGPTGILDYINEFLVEGEFCLIGEDGDHFLKFVEWPMTILVRGRFNVNNHAHILSGRNGATTRWLHAFFLNRDITFHLTRQGAGRFKLNKAALKNLPICVPDPAEQYEILDRIEAAQSSIEAQNRQLDKLRQQKHGLMHDLLTGRVRVKVDESKESSA